MKQFRLVILDEESDVMRPYTNRSKGLSDAQKCRRLMNTRKSKISSGKVNFAHFSSSKAQRCIVKFSFRYGKNNLIKHIAYIKKEGKGKEGEETNFYGNFYDNVDKADEKQFRIIISPEHQGIDLKVFTEKYISTLEASTGYDFLYLAAEHYDTAHKHVHLIINGIDKSGRKIQFDKEHIKHLFRSYASNICTSLVGHRTDDEINETKYNASFSNRLTFLDKDIVSNIKNNTLKRDTIARFSQSNLYINRLLHLENLGLCFFNSNKDSFILDKEYTKILQTLSRYSSFLDTSKQFNIPLSDLKLHVPSKNGSISGKVKQRFFMQENSTNHAVVIENYAGSLFYVPLKFPPATVQNGEDITISYEKGNGISERGRTSIIKK